MGSPVLLARPRVEPLEDRTLMSTCHVTRLSDSGAGKGFRGDLRYCINKVNAEPGPDAIDFTVTGTINLTGALPDLASEIDIQGPGPDFLFIRRDTGGNYRIMTVSGPKVRIQGVTLSNGLETVGGGIYNQGDLVLDDVTVSFNRAADQGGGIYNAGHLEAYGSRIRTNTVEPYPGSSFVGGGGIYNSGDLTIEYSEIFGNYVAAGVEISGGGMINADGAVATLKFSTIAENVALSKEPAGGGIYTAGTLTVDSSTVRGNSSLSLLGAFAHAKGGGIASACGGGSTLLLNSTIAENIATGDTSETSSGGGIFAPCPNMNIKNSTITKNLANAYVSAGGGVYGDVYMYNSIVAHNTITDSQPCGYDYCGRLKGSGYNIFSSSNGVTGFVDSDMLDVDPMLAPLADNGGPTLTHALLPGSPAIDAGDNTDAPQWDQRGPGFPRIANGTIDISAFEVQATPAPTTGLELAVLITAALYLEDTE